MIIIDLVLVLVLEGLVLVLGCLVLVLVLVLVGLVLVLGLECLVLVLVLEGQVLVNITDHHSLAAQSFITAHKMVKFRHSSQWSVKCSMKHSRSSTNWIYLGKDTIYMDVGCLLCIYRGVSNLTLR